MRDKVLQYCRRENLFSPGAAVVCAVSGGVDSVALLHCLYDLSGELEIRLSAAHFNHCLRGAESDADAAFVRRLCASMGVPLAEGSGDVRGCAERHGLSVEEAARALRYEFLRSLPGTIAVAHHGDDQVETVLLNLLRGTGLRGLSAMQPRQERVVRPFLSLTRQEILDYAAANGLSYCHDSTNDLDDALRNRLRHGVLPLLYAENPSLVQTVGRMTTLLRQEDAFLRRQAEQLLAQAADDGGWRCTVLRQAEPVLCRRALRQLLNDLPKPSMAQVDALEQLIGGSDGTVTIPLGSGHSAVRSYDLLRILREEPAEQLPEVALYPGDDRYLPRWGLRIQVQGPVILEKQADCLSTFAWRYDMIKCTEPIWLRGRRQGDVLRLAGGSRSLKRLMIDRKIPAPQRDRIPVLADGQGVLAVLGLGMDRERAAEPGEPALLIKIVCEERETT